MRNKIKKINSLLLKFFGAPPRKKKLPNPVDMLIGTILSQNTNDNNSYKAYKNLKNKFNKWEEVAALPSRQIEKLIKVGGLGKQKSKTIKNVLNELKKKQGKISLNYLNKLDNNNVINELIAFDGVGLKTASCVLLFSMNRDICPVDTHVHRTLNRIGVVKTNTPDNTFQEILEYIPKYTAHEFHTNLIRLGREICKPSKPNCSICPVENICIYESKNFDGKSKYKMNDFMLLDNIK